MPTTPQTADRRRAAAGPRRGPAGRRGGAALATLTLLLAAAPRAAAHGALTGAVAGVADIVHDYGVLLGLVAAVLIGAGVLAWGTLSPPTDAGGEAPEEPAAHR